MEAHAAISIPNLSKAIRQEGGKAIERRANRYGEQMVVAVKKIISVRYNTSRPDSRRHSGTQHLIDGWDYEVLGDPQGFPILLRLVSNGDSAYQKRIDLLNDGYPTHNIRARKRKRKTGKGPYLQYPGSGDGSTPGPPWKYAKEVTSPAQAGTHFVEGAAQTVLGAHVRAFR